MADKNLREFMTRLEAAGELVRVTEPVSPYLEMTEIQTRLLAEGGPAVLFENVVGKDGHKFDYPMLVNLFGSVKRAAWGMGREPDTLRELGKTLAFLRQPEPPGGLQGSRRHAAPGQDSPFHAPQNRRQRRLPRSGLGRR